MLLAVCKAGYCFTLFHFGSNGSNNDCGVLSNSLMSEGLETNTGNIPEDERIPLDGCKFTPLPYFLLGDDIFLLKKGLIKPYRSTNLSEEQKIYNYCLSCARHVIENTFGILAARWRIFHRPIRATFELVELYMFAALALHNYVRLTSNAMYTPSIHLGQWDERDIAQGFNNIIQIRGNRNHLEVIQMRNEIKEYLTLEEGSLPWQQEYIRRTYRNNDT